MESLGLEQEQREVRQHKIGQGSITKNRLVKTQLLTLPELPQIINQLLLWFCSFSDLSKSNQLARPGCLDVSMAIKKDKALLNNPTEELSKSVKVTLQKDKQGQLSYKSYFTSLLK